MPYCPHCGNEVDHVPDVAEAAETVSAEVEIARIQAERDVKVAQIQARQDKDWNETRVEVAKVEGEAEVAAAEATAEVIGEVIAAEAGDGEDTETEPAPVIVTAEPEDDAEDMAPPEVEPRETAPKKKSAWSFS